jgi:acetylornithine deacetylase
MREPGQVNGVLTSLEARIIARVRQGRDELVSLVADLVACDTTAREPGDAPRDEVKLQRLLASRLRDIGADVELFEPEAIAAGQSPTIPFALDFAGRPQLVAALPGTGGGRSLVLNGHIDAVTPGDVTRWSSDPFRAEIRDGLLYGRGTSDMKGGIAGFLFALECLAREGVRLGGDVTFCTNTDEESSGAGGLALVAHGVRGDAGLCAEPSGFDAWVACRGYLIFSATITGRAGHAEVPAPHWREGGAVNAIDRLEPILGAIRRLREDWRDRPDQRHPLLAPGDIVPVMVQGGEWIVTYPQKVTLTCDAQYLPSQVGPEGYGSPVREEIERAIGAAADSDAWLREHPVTFDFFSEAVPAEIPPDHPLVVTALTAAAALGRRGGVSALQSWHDPASFTRGGTPMFSFGPGGFETAHGVDERVPVQDLVDHCAATALTAMRFCGATR